MNERRDTFNRIYKSAVELMQAEREDDASRAFLQSAKYAPELWCDVATKLAKEGEEAMALEHFKMALQVTEHAQIRSGIFNNIGTIYARRGQLVEAEEMLQEALKSDSQSADAMTNMGQVAKWNNDHPASQRWIDRALTVNPWHGEAQFLKALNVLDSGDYENGFPLYECRWRSKTNGYRKVECFQPEWPGPNIRDFRTDEDFERIFIYCEQGAGDIFMMIRYAKMLRALGLWQHWAVKPGMGSLVAPLIDSYSEDGSPPEEFDCQAASASLPYLFKTTQHDVPSAHYLQRPELFPNYGEGFNIGIVWRGNTGQYNDRIRSTALSDWKPVFEAARSKPIRFISLQVDGADESLLYTNIHALSQPKDWMETAQRLAGLDLLISVDTGIVHLAGAMGIPVWCALHCRPYFVFPKNQPGTPWYPTVRLFKQQKTFEWQPVFEQIADELTTQIIDGTFPQI